MEIASFVKNIADTHRYGIDCIIDTDKLLALALSKMPNACIEPMESCNDSSNTNTVTTITCEGGTLTIESETVNTSHIITQISLFAKGLVNTIDLITNKTFSAKVIGKGLIGLNTTLFKISGQDIVVDKDNNNYNYITLGEFDWLTTNLKTTKYNDGTSILFHDTPATYTNNDAISLFLWLDDYEGLYSWYNDDINNKDTRGALYSKNAILNPKGLCPTGWRLPTNSELINMINQYNDKIRSTSLWTITPFVVNPNGFNLIPNGYKVASNVSSSPLKMYNARYFDLNNVASLWSKDNTNNGIVVQLDDKTIIPNRPNELEPVAMTNKNITDFFSWNGRGAYNALNNPPVWYPYYYPTGNCVRCMRNKK